MIYDKKTGDVIIIDRSKEKRKKIIQSVDDLDQERQELRQELEGVQEQNEQAKINAEWRLKLEKKF